MAVDWQKWLRRFALIFSVIVSFGASIGLGAFGVFYYKVVFGDDSYLKKSTIVARINEQTQIYFDDEKTPIGSFFEDSHRQYVNIEEIPAHMIMLSSQQKIRIFTTTVALTSRPWHAKLLDF